MKQRRKILFTIVGVLIFAVFLWAIVAPEPEPSYAGKTLSEWILQFHEGEYTAAPVQPMDAVILIGTNAVPHLVKWISYESPTWRVQINNIRNKLPSAIQFRWMYREKGFKLAAGSAEAFMYLGPRAKDAIPALAQQLQKRSSSAIKPRYIAEVLAQMGPEALPPLLEVATNQNIVWRHHVIFPIAYMGTNAYPAISMISNLVQDPNPVVSKEAKLAMKFIERSLKQAP